MALLGLWHATWGTTAGCEMVKTGKRIKKKRMAVMLALDLDKD
jgi:hypothetical protein